KRDGLGLGRVSGATKRRSAVSSLSSPGRRVLRALPPPWTRLAVNAAAGRLVAAAMAVIASRRGLTFPTVARRASTWVPVLVVFSLATPGSRRRARVVVGISMASGPGAADFPALLEVGVATRRPSSRRGRS